MTEIPSLRWLKESGVSDIAGEEPKNFFDIKDTLEFANMPIPAVEVSKPVTKNSQVAEMGFEEPVSDYSSLTEIVNEARKLADSAKNLEDLRKIVGGFQGCALKKTATNTVFADGNPKTGVMLIGEAPGADEDKMGIPFCGMSGMLLDKVLKAINLDRETGFYITNTIFWRPPGNRKPTPEEVAICKPFLEKHIALVQPKILLLVGATAVQAILRDNSSMNKLRGKIFKYSNQYTRKDVKVMVTYHPSYLMRSPLNKRLAWDDMLMFDSELKKMA